MKPVEKRRLILYLWLISDKRCLMTSTIAYISFNMYTTDAIYKNNRYDTANRDLKALEKQGRVRRISSNPARWEAIR